MNYITEAIEYLTHYKDLDIANDNIELRIKEVESELEGCKGAVYSDMPKGSKAMPDDRICNLIFQKDRLKELHEENKLKLSQLENMFNKLEDEYRDILKLSYVERKNEMSILDELSMSRATYYRLRTKAIKSFAIQLFGIAAIK